jgi:uracil-DNA glycosylase family 4
VPHWGDPNAWLAICGLAPGKHGANRTGRPFTGDHAGVLLFDTLRKFGLAEGRYEERPDDSLRLLGVAIVNSVKCVPPQNKPTPQEIATCTSAYFRPSLAALSNVRVMVALGRIAHDAALRAAGVRLSSAPFAHLAEHRLPDGRVLVDSYHCSRYNQNTNRLTAAMFAQVFARALELRT